METNLSTVLSQDSTCLKHTIKSITVKETLKLAVYEEQLNLFFFRSSRDSWYYRGNLLHGDFKRISDIKLIRKLNHFVIESTVEITCFHSKKEIESYSQ